MYVEFESSKVHFQDDLNSFNKDNGLPNPCSDWKIPPNCTSRGKSFTPHQLVGQIASCTPNISLLFIIWLVIYNCLPIITAATERKGAMCQVYKSAGWHMENLWQIEMKTFFTCSLPNNFYEVVKNTLVLETEEGERAKESMRKIVCFHCSVPPLFFTIWKPCVCMWSLQSPW